MRPTELAEHVGLSKQALNPLLNDLDAAGYLTRQLSETDGRHRILLLTPRGEKLLADAKAILEEIERELAEAVGARRYATFRSVLTDLPSLLDLER